MQFILIQQAIHESLLEEIPRGAHGEFVEVGVQRFHGHAPRHRDIAPHARPEILHECGQLLAVRVGHALAQIGFHGALVGIVRASDDGHLDAEVGQHPLVEGRLQAHAAQFNATFGMQVQLVGHRTHPIGALGVDLAPCDNPLAGGLEPGQCIAHLAKH